MKISWCFLAAIVHLVVTSCSLSAAITTNIVSSDNTWRTSRGSEVTATNWTVSLAFDDSDAAGWTNAFQVSGNNHIWHTSNQSSQSPSRARFRHLFTLSQDQIVSVTGHFTFDDNGSAWINGTQIINDTGGGASTFDLTLDPLLFQPGDNLIAVWGVNTVAPFNSISVNMTIVQVPEPSAAVLSAAGLAGWAVYRRRCLRGRNEPSDGG